MEAFGAADDQRGITYSLVPPGTESNLLQLHRDTPRAWDAWDIDVEYVNQRGEWVGTESYTGYGYRRDSR